jgi:GTP cyclohydrolase IIa
MSWIQVTVIQLDNYGPWTVTPEPKLESELQILQAKIYAYLQEKFAKLGGVVFHARQDNLIAVTNGIDIEHHKSIAQEFAREFPLTASMGIGIGRQAYEAQVNATLALQGAGSSRSAQRRAAVVGEVLGDRLPGWVKVAHADINHSTLFTDTKPIYDTHLLIQHTYNELADQFLQKGALVFYMGGDNFIALINGLDDGAVVQVFKHIKRRLGVELKAGIGEAPSPLKAVHLASKALQEIRAGKERRLLARRKEPSS